MTDREILDMRIKNLKKLRRMYLFGAIFFLHPVPFFLLMIIGYSGDFIYSLESIKNLFLMIICILMFLFLGIWLAKFSRIYIKLLKTLEGVDPSESDTKILKCDKYRFIVRGKSKHTTYKTGITIFADGEIYYYIFVRESHSLGHIPLGEHEFELYKGTNIIKKFDVADDAQSKFTIWG